MKSLFNYLFVFPLLVVLYVLFFAVIFCIVLVAIVLAFMSLCFDTVVNSIKKRCKKDNGSQCEDKI